MMQHRLIYLAIGSALLFVCSGIFKAQIHRVFFPYADLVFAILTLVGIGVPFAALTLFRVRENPRLLDQLFNLHIAKRKAKKRYARRLNEVTRKTVVNRVREKRHPYIGEIHRKQRRRKLNSPPKKRKRDNSNDFAYPDDIRKVIVEKYWEARRKGEVENRDAWARRYNITGHTLHNYETWYLAEKNENNNPH